MKHIYWFAYFSDEEPSVRYRAIYALRHLQSHYGIDYTFVYPSYRSREIIHFIQVYLEVLFIRKPHSLIVFQKIYSKGIYAKALMLLLFLRPNYTLYDIDDAEYTRRPDATINYFIKNCSYCSAGSEALIQYIRQFNKQVFLLTSPVIEHKVFKKKVKQRFTIGWIGYYGAHQDSLKTLLFPALCSLDAPVKLKLLGVSRHVELDEIKAFFRNYKHVEIEAPLNIYWKDELQIYNHISTFDVGVAPLLNTPFNRAKSAFKLKQCLSCGIPVLGSDVGENTRFLRSGENGFLCKDAAEFESGLLYFLKHGAKEQDNFYKHALASVSTFSMKHYAQTLMQELPLPS